MVASAPCVCQCRTYTVDPTAHPPTLHYVVDMATTKTPNLTRHLEGFLTKWTDDEDDASDASERGDSTA